MKNIKNNRESNIELLKIFSMIAIIMHHYAIYSGFQFENTIFINRVIIDIFGWIGKVGLSSFIIISGYFYDTTRFKIKKVVKILLEVWVYSIIGLVIGIAIKSDKLNLTNVIKSIMPNLFGLYWYTTCYLLIYIFSSNFKMIIDKTDKKRLTINIVLMLLIWSFITMIPQTRTYGNNFIYLVMIYFIGAYIKKYNVKILKENKSRIICIMIVVLAIIIYIVAMECISRNYVDYFSGIQSPVILILSIFILNIFKSFKMKNNIYINKIAGATLGIYLIHENVFLRYFIWRTLISGNKYIESPWFVIYSILAILFIFIICCIAHLFIEKILINNIYVLIEKIYHKICKKDIFIKIRKNINNFICEKEGTK